MDFFQAQDDARRNTWRLALLFGAAVLTLIVLTNVLVAVVALWATTPSTASLGLSADPVGYVLGATSWESWLFISLGVVGVVAAASLYKYVAVSGGGRTIAEALGGRPLQPSSSDLGERRLLNVVEEMAIASGTPVPPVYLIPEYPRRRREPMPHRWPPW